MNRIKTIAAIVRDVIVVVGALACLLVWLEIKPNDIKGMVVPSLPHSLWLIAALLLILVSLRDTILRYYNFRQKEGSTTSEAKVVEAVLPVPMLKKPRLTLQNRADTFLVPFPLVGAMAYAVYFVNDEERYDNTAYGVSVSLEFEHIEGDKRKSVGLWMVNSQNGQITWTERMSIRMGDDARCLPLLYWGSNTRPCVYFPFDAKALNVNAYGIMINVKEAVPLQYGQWDMLLKLTGDNVEEEWAMTITLGPKPLIRCSQPIRKTR